MCGLVGVARFEKVWKISATERSIFLDLLIADSVRGTHGTGVMHIREDGDCRTIKIPADPYQLLRDPQFKDHFDPPWPKGMSWKEVMQDVAIFGHNRYKTTGKISVAHTHPHKIGDITLIHNGTLLEYCELPKFKSFDVDTMALTHAINELGIDDAISRTRGAYAIIYYNEKEKTINILRNDKRPLYFGTDLQNGRVYWASEEKMLEWILARTTLGVRPEIHPVPVDTLHTYSLDSAHPVTRPVLGPKTNLYHRGMSSFENDVEYDITDFFQKSRPKPQDLKAIQKTLQTAKKMGLKLQIIDQLLGFKKGDVITFRVCDYVDVNERNEEFLIKAESPVFANASIRFKLKGVDKLNQIFDHPNMVAQIANLVEYPTGNEDSDKYVIWVREPELVTVPDVEVEPTAVTPYSKVRTGDVTDSYGRKVGVTKIH